jgi:hypothetical protein
MEALGGEMMYNSNSFLTLALGRDEQSASCLGNALPQREDPWYSLYRRPPCILHGLIYLLDTNTFYVSMKYTEFLFFIICKDLKCGHVNSAIHSRQLFMHCALDLRKSAVPVLDSSVYSVFVILDVSNIFFYI